MAGEVYQDVVKTVTSQSSARNSVMRVPALVVDGTSTFTGAVTSTGALSSASGLSILGNVLSDSSAVNRFVPNPTAKTIADGAATSLADVACASNSTAGGMIFYFVQASDGTDFQAMSGMVAYSVVNKATVLTLTITDVTANNAKAVSSGTLTLAWTFVAGTAKGTIKLQPTGSLTETTPYNVTYSVFPLIGAVTIL